MSYYWCKACNAEMEPARWHGGSALRYQCPCCGDFVESTAPGHVQTHRPSRWVVTKWLLDEYKRKLRKVAS